MEITYQVFAEDNLLIQRFCGEFNFEEYMWYSSLMKNIPNIQKIDKVLIDFRDVIFDIVPELLEERLDEIIGLRMKMNKTSEINNSSQVSIVFWVDDPLPTVIAHILKISLPQDYSYYSTAGHIINNLQLDFTESQLELSVKKLKNNFVPNQILNN